MIAQCKPRLCILNIDGYPLYNPRCQSWFGGAEVQCFLLAQGLAETGQFDVHVIVTDHGQPRLEYKDGVKVHPHSAYCFAVRVDDTLKTSFRWWTRRMMRALIFRLHGMHREYIGNYPIILSQIAIYDEVNADIYLARMNTQSTADLAFYCNQQGKPFVFVAASDADYSPEYQDCPELKYVIEKATLHIVQTQHQSVSLQANYGRSSVVIRSLVDTKWLFPQKNDSNVILWVGKANDNKHPELVLDLARALPEYEYVLIMTPAESEYSRRIELMSRELDNVTLLNYVPYGQVESHFARAKVFVNTSGFEGFPNTFLQAAKYGVPIVSHQVDPGEMISKHGCGLLCNGDFEQLKRNVRTLMEKPGIYSALSDNAMKYVRDYHDKNKVIYDYVQAISSVLTDLPGC